MNREENTTTPIQVDGARTTRTKIESIDDFIRGLKSRKVEPVSILETENPFDTFTFEDDAQPATSSQKPTPNQHQHQPRNDGENTHFALARPGGSARRQLVRLDEEESKMFLMQDRSNDPFEEIEVKHSGSVVYLLNSDGVFSQRILNKGETEPAFLCEPIEPVAILEKGEGFVFILVRYRDSVGEIRETVVKDSEFTNLNGDNYPRFVFPGSTDKQKISTALNLIFTWKKAMGSLPILKCYGQVGWTETPASLPEKVAEASYISSADPRFQSDEAVAVVHGQAGDEKIWLDAITRAATHSKMYGFCLAYGFSAFAKGLIFRSNVNVNLNIYGEKSKGKSTTIALVASLQGGGHKSLNDTPIVDMTSTDVSVERFKAPSNHGILCLEEADDKIMFDSRAATSFFMDLGNGGGRNRIVKGKAKKLQVVQNTIFSTSNSSLVDVIQHNAVDKDGALRDRILSIDIMDPAFEREENSELRGIEKVLFENYGFAFRPVTELLKTRFEHYKQVYRLFCEEAMEKGFSVRGEERLAQIKLGVVLMKDFFIEKGVEIPEESWEKITHAISIIEEREMERLEEEQRKFDVRSQLRTFLATHIGKFVLRATNGRPGRGAQDIPCYLYDPSAEGTGLNKFGDAEAQARYAREHNQRVLQSSKQWGRIEQLEPMQSSEGFTGRVIITVPHKDDIERTAGIDLDVLKKVAEEQGALIEMDRTRNIFGLDNKLVRVLCFDLSKFTEEDFTTRQEDDCPF